jgi:tetratricopeptide (TPR) repeat protein
MVLRYWGTVGVRPTDFAAALSTLGRGITTDTLRQLAEERGYRALALRGEPQEAMAQLDKGRPLIALTDAGPRGYHYVVLLAWANRRVLFHDPARGPFRVMPEAEWLRRWNASDRWALLILPNTPPEATAQRPLQAAAEADACASYVRPAIESADRGDLQSAKRDLAAAAEACPESSAPLRELAGLEFRLENWAGASALAERAVARNRDDALSWRLLATSRFLAGRPEAALDAWNRIGEPRLDIVKIDGLARTPFRTVYDSLGSDDDELLTPQSLRWTERRVAALPAASGSRVSYRPLPGGRAELEVAIVERPTIDPLPPLLLESAIRAFTDHAVALSLANLTATGDHARAFWRWQPNRPQVSFAASAPRALGLPGIVTAELLWDEQSYRAPAEARESDLIRERRRRASLSLDDWWRADSKLGVTLAVDEWSERGRSLSISGSVDQRFAGDRVSIRGRVSGWGPWRSGRPFYSGSLRFSARSRVTDGERPQLRLDLAYEAASARAPLALWPGAGTGLGRDLLLRAHPLVRDGIVDGRCFGREILRAGVEGEAPAVRLGPVRLSPALFVDSVRVLAPLPGVSSRQTFVDLGAGLRVRIAGRRSTLRADIAIPWGSVRPRLSVGWQAQWPE